MDPRSQAKFKVFSLFGLLAIILGILFITVQQFLLGTAPSDSGAAGTIRTDSETCANVWLYFDYGDYSPDFRVLETDWDGPISSNGPSSPAARQPYCGGANGQSLTQGNFRVAIYDGDITTTNYLQGFISRAPLNFLDLTNPVSNPPTEKYTIACMQVTANQENPAIWTPTGLHCNALTIWNPAAKAPQGPGEGEVSCGPLDTNQDGGICLTDLSAFAAVYGGTCGPCTPTTESGYQDTTQQDVNGDCKLSAIDLSNLATQYSAQCN